MDRPVALVTGSARKRIGHEVATHLARAGYDVAIHYRTARDEAVETCRELFEHGVDALPVEADVADDAEVRHMVDAVHQRFGHIDVLVHTAAAYRPTPLDETTTEDVEWFWRINTLGTFLCARAVGLAMADQPSGGSIVLLGDWAIESPYSGYGAYFASKGAIPTLVRTFAVELAQRNRRVRVNGIHPGPILLPEDFPEEARQAAIGATLLKREGHPRNIAQAVLMLAENDFITGTMIPVDGGRTIYPAGQPKPT